MYRHYIENKDEKFFLEHTYDEVELDESFDLNQLVKKLKEKIGVGLDKVADKKQVLTGLRKTPRASKTNDKSTNSNI